MEKLQGERSNMFETKEKKTEQIKHKSWILKQFKTTLKQFNPNTRHPFFPESV